MYYQYTYEVMILYICKFGHAHKGWKFYYFNTQLEELEIYIRLGA